MPRRTQILVLSGLAVFLVALLYLEYRPQDPAPAVSSVSANFEPLPVENPALRLDLLDRLKKFQYEGSHRNIFSASLPPPVRTAAPAVPAAPAKPVAPPPPPGPPPLVVPATFFGYVTDARTGTRRAFFSDADDVYVVAVGETLLGRFRLVQIGNNTAEIQEVATGRMTTLTMTEEPGPS
jgi:hypothetical protein